MFTIDLNWSEPIKLAINQKINPGEVVALLGPSGCGKSTVLNTLSGLTSASGSLLYNELSLLKCPPEQRPVALAPQKPTLFPHWTVQKHIQKIQSLKKNATFHQQPITSRELIQKLSIEPLLNKYPHQLSGGQQQRVSLLLALLQAPKLLLLDEAFSALDEVNKQEVLKITKEMISHFQCSAIVVSHQLRDCAVLANQAWLMSEETGIYWQGPIQEGLRRYQGENPTYSFLQAKYQQTESNLNTFTIDSQQLYGVSGKTYTKDENVTLSLCADDIGISLSPPESTSFANCLQACIRLIQPDTYGAYIFCRLCDGQQVQTHITKNSLAQLNLQIEDNIYLIFKAGALDSSG